MLSLRAHQSKPTIGFQFCPCPVELLRRNDVSPAGKLLFMVLLDSARGSRSGMSKLCNATLGARIGKSASEAGRHLAELESLGLVRREYGPSKRIRAGVAITWVPEIPATPESTSTRSDQPGSANPVNRVQQTSATIQSPPSEPRDQTGQVFEVSGGEDPKPSPQQIAAAMREMIAGRFGGAMFEPKGAHQTHTLSPKGTHETCTLDPKPLFRQVGYSAVAAIVQAKPPRKSADQQLAELAAWRRRQE